MFLAGLEDFGGLDFKLLFLTLCLQTHDVFSDFNFYKQQYSILVPELGSRELVNSAVNPRPTTEPSVRKTTVM